MLKQYFKIFLLFVIAAKAESAEQLSTPQNLRATTEKSFSKCIKAVEKHVNVGNQLTSDGLNSCYAETKSIYTDNIERAKKRIEQSKDTSCRKFYSELEEKWKTYANDTLKTDSLAEMPLNTDDNLEILLLTHKYEIAYTIANNSGCNF